MKLLKKYLLWILLGLASPAFAGGPMMFPLYKDYLLEQYAPHYYGQKIHKLYDQFKVTFPQQAKDLNKFWPWAHQHGAGKIPQVVYLSTPKAQALYRVKFNNKQIIFNPTVKRQLPANATALMFVMDNEYNFYVFPKDRGSVDRKAFQHSSFLAGEPVAAAGTFHVDKDNNILIVSDYSGHYRMPKEGMQQALDGLKRHHVPIQQLDIQYF